MIVEILSKNTFVQQISRTGRNGVKKESHFLNLFSL